MVAIRAPVRADFFWPENGKILCLRIMRFPGTKEPALTTHLAMIRAGRVGLSAIILLAKEHQP